MRAGALLVAALVAGCGDDASSGPLDLAAPADQAAPSDLHVPPLDGCTICVSDLAPGPDLATIVDLGDDLAVPLDFASLPPDLSCGCDGGVCDPLTSACGECDPANDTCADGLHCTRTGGVACNQPTVTGCNPGTVCMPSDTTCNSFGCCRVPCGNGQFPCPVGQVCVHNGDCGPTGCCVPPPSCAPGCKSDGECQSIPDGGGTSFARCCSGQCVDTASDDNNCGSCGGSSCSRGGASCCCGVCALGACTITQTSAQNCGSCGHVCGLGQVCASGNCQ